MTIDAGMDIARTALAVSLLENRSSVEIRQWLSEQPDGEFKTDMRARLNEIKQRRLLPCLKKKR